MPKSVDKNFPVKAKSSVVSLGRLGLVCLLALFVTACGTPPDSAFWSSAASPKINKVSLVALNFDVPFEGQKTDLKQASRRALDGFLRRQNINYSDQLYVVAGIDVVTPLALARAKTIRSYLLRKGYRSELLDRAEWAGGKIQKANRPTVRIVVHRFVVTAPRCPDWRKTPASDGANTPSSNLGCANTVNLGLMVANPRDLVSGRETGPMDGTRAAAGINRYRNGKVTKLLDSGTTE